MRVDVQLPAPMVEAELRRLYRRLYTPGDSLHGIATLPLALPGLACRHRVADGEHYVYVEDLAQGRLAGYTVFNRLIELDRRADPYLRGPHSRYAEGYQRRGIATAVYEWALSTGMCLITGPRQSVGAHALWDALARRHPRAYVQLRDKVLRLLGPEVTPQERDDFHTRMVMLGAGWDFARVPGWLAAARQAKEIAASSNAEVS